MVTQLKEKYALVADIVVASMRFVCGGVECLDDMTLQDCGIQEGAPVMVVYQVDGGQFIQ